MRPVDPRLVREVPQARLPVGALGLVGVVQGAATVASAFALAAVVVAVSTGGDGVTAVVVLAALIAVRALLAGATELLAAWAGHRVTRALRRRLLERWLEAPADERPDPSGAVTLAVQGTSSIEPYVARFLPALIHAAVVPALAVVALVVVDPLSALVVVATLPLLPLFAALIGRTTEEATRRRWRALADLSGHFLDVVRGLPTLVSYGRGERQVEVIGDVSDRHRVATLGTLRLAFLSSAALELLATISVALVAVTSGLRLAAGSMPLDTALVAILLAPEAYWPIRRVGTEFHNAADGAEALADVLADEAPDRDAARRTTVVSDGFPDLESAPSEPAPDLDLDDPADPDRGRWAVPTSVRVHDLGYAYPGTSAPVIAHLDLALTAGLTVITGPSGCGKSTLLELLATLRAPTSGSVTTLPAHVVTQRPFLPTGTLLDALRLGNRASRPQVWAALRRVGLDGLAAGLPHGLETVIGDDGFGLSAGQRARIALARATLATEPLILLDEPTAHLDPDNAALAHHVINALARHRIVVAVTHRAELVQLADRHVHLTHELDRARGGATP